MNAFPLTALNKWSRTGENWQQQDFFLFVSLESTELVSLDRYKTNGTMYNFWTCWGPPTI